jgi:HK97 family phage major capsid protein
MLARIGETQTRRDEILALGDKATEADGIEFEALVNEAEKLQSGVAVLERGEILAAATSKPQPLPTGIVVGNPVAEDAKYPIGDFLQDVFKAGTGKTPSARLDIQNKRFKAAANGMNESAPSDGGFLVGTEQAGMLAERAYNEGQIAALCDRVPISGAFNGLKYPYIDESDRADGSRSGGVLAYWKNEAAALASSAPKIGEETMNLEKLTGLFYATDELLQDATALGAMASSQFGREFAFKLDDAILNGTGAGQPLGILNSAALVSQAKETGQTASTINFDNIVKMYARLWSGANSATTRWVMNRECFPQLMSLAIKVGTAGFPLYVAGNSLTGAPNGTLLGIPVVFAEQALALGTAGDIYLADFGQYRIIEKAGIQMASSIHVQFLTDQQVFRWVMRVNGQPLWKKPLTPYKGTSSTVSPFVALAVRS